MYDLIVCTCGTPLGFIYEYPVLKQFNFTKEGDKFVEELEQLFKSTPNEHHAKLRQFILVSCQHF